MADISMSYNTVSELESKAAFLQNGINEFIRDFNSVTREIMNGWDGKAKTDFAANCDAVLPVMTAVSDSLGKYSAAIGRAVYLQQSIESTNAANISMLTSGSST